jgi:hypothetical protein
MAGYRQIHTQIWKDEWYIDLSPEEKLIFVYLFSNELASISGIYKIPARVISNETGVSYEDVLIILENFEQAGKILYADGVLWVKNMSKFHANASPRTQKKVEADVEKIPDCAVKQAYLQYRDCIDTVSVPRSESESKRKKQSESGSGNKNGSGSGNQPPKPKSAAAAGPAPSGLYQAFLEAIHDPDPPPVQTPYPEWESIFAELSGQGVTDADVKEAVRWLRANGKHPSHPRGIRGAALTALRQRCTERKNDVVNIPDRGRYLKGQYSEFINH